MIAANHADEDYRVFRFSGQPVQLNMWMVKHGSTMWDHRDDQPMGTAIPINGPHTAGDVTFDSADWLLVVNETEPLSRRTPAVLVRSLPGTRTSFWQYSPSREIIVPGIGTWHCYYLDDEQVRVLYDWCADTGYTVGPASESVREKAGMLPTETLMIGA